MTLARRSPWARLLAVAVYAVAMAYVEAAVVVYLRALYGIEALPADAPSVPDAYTAVELGREAATLIMIAVVGVVTGSRWQDRAGFAAWAFGLWDLASYAWLHLLIGWPASLLDWDLLFLLPLPWWGPVLAPALVAGGLAFAGRAAVLRTAAGYPPSPTRWEWTCSAGGALLALYLFQADSIEALPRGVAAVAAARPSHWSWPRFGIAAAVMLLPLFRALGRAARRAERGADPV